MICGYFSHRWKAANTVKALRGAVRYELDDYDGNPVYLSFEPEVVYDEDRAPFPWTVVAPRGRVLSAEEAGAL